jgi:site-specific DNA recombinase
MKFCGLYLRVSTSIQAQVKDGSLDTQCDILKKYIELKDQTSDEEWKATSIYREEGKSGKNTNRPEYKRMIIDVKKGKINAIICTKIDRVSRSLMDFYHFHELLEEYDVNFISLNEQWDTSIPMGRFALKITLAAAELEREQTAERIKEKMQWRAEQGLSNGGQIIGYDIDEENKGIPKINEEEKDLVIRIFQTYLQEQSFLRVAEIINDKGYRSKFYISRRGNIQGGKKFTNTAIARILQNPYYIGQITHKDQRFDGKHEPIVPIDLWRKAKAIVSANRALNRKNRKQNLHTFRLQGLVRCGDCGSFMTPYYGMNRSKRAYFYYTCTRKNHLGKSGCSMKPVPAEAIEDVVARRLIQLSKNKSIITDIVEEATSESSRLLKNYTKTHSNLVKRKVEIEEKIDVLVESIADRKVGIKSISQKIIELEEVREKLADEILDIEGEIEEIQKKVVNAASLEGSLTTFKEIYEEATHEEQRELMRLHLNQLVWSPGEIHLALFDQPSDGMRTNVQRELINGGGGGIRTRVRK